MGILVEDLARFQFGIVTRTAAPKLMLLTKRQCQFFQKGVLTYAGERISLLYFWEGEGFREL